MKKVLVTAATFKPLEVEAVKVRPELRIAAATDNLVVADLIQSAIEAYEEFTNNVLCLSTWDLYFDEFPDEIETPGPLSSITSVKYLDTSGAEATLATTVYKASTSNNPLFGLITLKYGQSWPSAYSEADAVYARAVLGYANAAAIPQLIKNGLIAKIQELYYGIDMRARYEADWSQYRRQPI
jgi:uncharacterized phiE125 gp8 family phage protein